VNGEPTRAEICVTACADTWADAGEVLGSPIGALPTVGARLARLTTAPDLVLSDGEVLLMAELPPIGTSGLTAGVIEGWMPYRKVFDVVASGRRQVMMGASQIDRHGNQNIAQIGRDWKKPKVQLIGVRGAPGNTVNHPTNYWVPRHSTRVFVDSVDLASGVGHDRAAAGGPAVARYHDVRVVVTNLAVLDFATPDRTMRLRSVHPGVSVDEVVAATGFALDTAEVTETRRPTAQELRLIREVVDPANVRDREFLP
jgi:acyl CoA:acetate/3-ketoacid CoA transferase beta subunit